MQSKHVAINFKFLDIIIFTNESIIDVTRSNFPIKMGYHLKTNRQLDE